MDIESRRDLELLRALEHNSQVTQRKLSAKLGIALGLTNIYLKRLVRKGYIKCVTIPPNRLMYFVTPSGLARKAKLTYRFMQYSFDLVRDSRREMRRKLEECLNRDQKVMALYGTGEAAELAYLAMRELSVELAAVFSDEPVRPFLGLPVRPIHEQHLVAYDVMIVTALDPTGAIVNRLAKDGVPRDRIITLGAPPHQVSKTDAGIDSSKVPA